MVFMLSHFEGDVAGGERHDGAQRIDGACTFVPRDSPAAALLAGAGDVPVVSGENSHVAR